MAGINWKELDELQGARSRITFADKTNAVGNLDELIWNPSRTDVRSLQLNHVVLTLDDSMERIPSYIFSTDRITRLKISGRTYSLPTKDNEPGENLWAICPESIEALNVQPRSSTPQNSFFHKDPLQLPPDASVAGSLSKQHYHAERNSADSRATHPSTTEPSRLAANPQTHPAKQDYAPRVSVEVTQRPQTDELVARNSTITKRTSGIMKQSFSSLKEAAAKSEDNAHPPAQCDPEQLEKLQHMRIRVKCVRNNLEIVGALTDFSQDAAGVVLALVFKDVTLMSDDGVKRQDFMQLQPDEIKQIVLPNIYRNADG